VEDEPVEQIGHLADSSSDAGSRLTHGQFHPFEETAPAGGLADEAAEGENLAGADGHAVDERGDEGKIHHLVLLEPPVAVSEDLDEARGVALHQTGQGDRMPRGEGLAVSHPGKPPPQPVVADRHAVDQGVTVAEKHAVPALPEESGEINDRGFLHGHFTIPVGLFGTERV
jgi:hypothetical protein